MNSLRALYLLRKFEPGIRNSVNGISKTAVRHAGGGEGFSYRRAAYPPKPLSIYLATFFGAFTWWWILWHVFTQPEHLLGEFPYPDPSKWTDEELGIPPDEE